MRGCVQGVLEQPGSDPSSPLSKRSFTQISLQKAWEGSYARPAPSRVGE